MLLADLFPAPAQHITSAEARLSILNQSHLQHVAQTSVYSVAWTNYNRVCDAGHGLDEKSTIDNNLSTITVHLVSWQVDLGFVSRELSATRRRAAAKLE